MWSTQTLVWFPNPLAAEKSDGDPVYPVDPSVPYEERCIMWWSTQIQVDPSGPYQGRCIMWSTSGSLPSQWEEICILWSISGLVCLWSTSSLLVIYLWSTRALEVNYPCMSSLDIIGGHSTPLLCDRHTDFPKWNETFPVTLKSVKAHASVIFLQLLVIPAASSAATKVITCQAWCNCLRLSDRS